MRQGRNSSSPDVRRLILTLLAGLVFALATVTGAMAADHTPEDACPPLDESFCVVDEQEPDGILPTSGGGVFVLVAFLWATPLVLASVFAARNKENVRTAVMLTLFLGWIGLLIVYRGQRRSAADLIRASEPGGGRVRNRTRM